MRRLVPLTLAILVTVAAAREASGDPVRVTFDDRNLEVFASVNDLPPLTGEIGSHVPLAAFDETTAVTATQGNVRAHATATQRSSVTPTHYRASGSVDALERTPDLGSSALSSAESFFSTSFVLPAPYRFVLSDLMAASAVTPPGGFDHSQSFVALFSGATASFVLIENLDGTGARQVNRTGVLPAGDYGFQAVAVVERFLQATSLGERQRASFDVEFQLTPVPEPATLLLFGTGMAAGVRHARKSRPPKRR